jgi:hypothetical protein
MRNKQKVGVESSANFSQRLKSSIKPIESTSQDLKGRDKVMRIIVERLYLTTFWGRSFERFVGVIVTVTSIGYIVQTYLVNELPEWYDAINFIALCIFLFDLTVRLYISTHRMSFITSRS